MFNTSVVMTERPKSPPPPPRLPAQKTVEPVHTATVTVSTPGQRRAERKAPHKADKAQRKASAKANKARLKVEQAQVKEMRKLEPKPAKPEHEPVRPLYQMGLLARSAHPLQAVIMAAVIGVIAAFDKRGVGGTLIAATGVLLTQLALGLLNDAYDEKSDARGDRSRKPVASGALPPGNATYLAVVLALASIPVAVLNGTIAGAALLLTLPVGFLHNRILHRTPASFIGWMVTFPLLVTYLAYGSSKAGRLNGWAQARTLRDDAPTWQLLVAAAALGLVCHFLTSLPDLASDHKAGLSELPLVIARRTGAAVLLAVTVVCLIAAIGACVWCGLHFGLRQR